MSLGKFINQIKLYCENNNIHNYNIRQKRHIHEPLGRTAHNIQCYTQIGSKMEIYYK